MTDQYYLLLGDKPEGPFAQEQLSKMWQSGEIGANDLFARAGSSEWQPIKTISRDLGPLPKTETMEPACPRAESTNLIPCPDCRKDVSASAFTCPNCGRKLRSEQTAIGIVAAIIIGLIVAGILYFAINNGAEKQKKATEDRLRTERETQRMVHKYDR